VTRVKRVTVELVVMTVRRGRLEALVARLPHSVWALPSAPVCGAATLELAAERALAEQAGVRGVALEQLYTFAREDTDALSVAYLALIAAERHPLAPGPGVVEVRWFPVDDLPALAPEQREVLEYGHARLRAKSAYAPLAFQLLPETFTLGELQEVYEAVLGTPLDTRNFRRDVLAAGVVAPVGRTRSLGPGRPAQLYRCTGGEFSVIARERRMARSLRLSAGTPVLSTAEEPA
jgi:8-oxo-dGTP diphosphatase